MPLNHREHVQVPLIFEHTTQPPHSHPHKHEVDAAVVSAHEYVSRVTHGALIVIAQKLDELSTQCKSNSFSAEQTLVNFRLLTECANALSAVQRTCL